VLTDVLVQVSRDEFDTKTNTLNHGRTVGGLFGAIVLCEFVVVGLNNLRLSVWSFTLIIIFIFVGFDTR
jgi:hypothetical protein